MLVFTVKFSKLGCVFEQFHNKMLSWWGKQVCRAMGSPSGESGVPELRTGRGAPASVTAQVVLSKHRNTNFPGSCFTHEAQRNLAGS
jgi:hypothetical protein